MQRTGAAEGDELEVARVIAALYRDHLERLAHGRVGDLQDAGRGGGRVHAEALAERGKRPCGCPGIEFHLAAEEIFRVQPAEEKVGIGDRCLSVLPSIAGRTRDGAGADRTDTQFAAVIDPSEAAAAGPDLDEVYRWR